MGTNARPRGRSGDLAERPARSTTAADPQLGSEWRTIAEGADLLHVSKRTMFRLIDEGSLPAYKVGGRCIRVRLADLLALVQRVA